jgi:hypothetical protein
MSMAARMAMALTCIEAAARAEGLTPGPIDDVVDLLWRFVESEDLSAWEGELVRMQDATEGFARLPVPDWVRQMLHECATHGDSYVCSAIEDVGPESLRALLRLFAIAEDHGYRLPDTQTFLQSSFAELDGWGGRHPRDWYRRP